MVYGEKLRLVRTRTAEPVSRGLQFFCKGGKLFCVSSHQFFFVLNIFILLIFVVQRTSLRIFYLPWTWDLSSMLSNFGLVVHYLRLLELKNMFYFHYRKFRQFYQKILKKKDVEILLIIFILHKYQKYTWLCRFAVRRPNNSRIFFNFSPLHLKKLTAYKWKSSIVFYHKVLVIQQK